MEILNRYQRLIFAVACLAVAAALFLRLLPSLPIYFDAGLRRRASEIISATASREGWIKSGLVLVSVNQKKATVLYRSYLHGKDPVRCFEISLYKGSLSPCISK